VVPPWLRRHDWRPPLRSTIAGANRPRLLAVHRGCSQASSAAPGCALRRFTIRAAGLRQPCQAFIIARLSVMDLASLLLLFNAQKMVDLRGFEPLTSSMPLRRAPNCATGPRSCGRPAPLPTYYHAPILSRRSSPVKGMTAELAGTAALRKPGPCPWHTGGREPRLA
jgi:hypothetical protein